MNEISLVVVEGTNTIMAITPDELAAVQECRKRKEREALVEKYRNEMAELLERMGQDHVGLECSYYGNTAYCDKLSPVQHKDRVRIC